MPPVFAHGRLRLYLLKLLDEAPRHGYEVIRLLEERFQGLYAPSAGTVYPRLAKLEAEGLVTHATEGGRKVYSITEAGRAELAGRVGELADLEQEIRDSVSELAAEIRADVRGAAGRLRSEMRAAAGTQTRQARRQAQEFQRVAKEVQDQVQSHFIAGDWPTGVREGLTELTTRLSGLLDAPGTPWATPPETPAADEPGTAGRKDTAERSEMGVPPDGVWGRNDAAGRSGAKAPAEPVWEPDMADSGDPLRDLDRLLDRFRDDVRDAARDHGVDAEQFAEARAQLGVAAGRLLGLLRRSG
ncbi:PadR family transcriptional regulator [Streptomyces sp. NPDC048604]|uniref:PadR family transcriptional regulator n=1 Tax=Streptomyces sp. NPDC048604 TaxID=3365578 RepID=UPI003715C8E5